MSVITPRDYQSHASLSVDAALRHTDENPCVVIPTGGGKTVVIADLVRRYLTTWPGTRIAVVAHVKELVSQNAEKLRVYWPERREDVGVFSAGLRKRDIFHPVIFASIQSVYKKALQLGRFDLIFIDEAHRIPLDGDGLYRRFIADCAHINPLLRVVGFTATPYRMSRGMVCGPDYVLNRVCYEAGVYDLIQQGYLSQLTAPGHQLDGATSATGLHVRKGEYVSSEVEDLVNQNGVVEAAVREIVKYSEGRRGLIVFAHSIAHAEHVSAELAGYGVVAPVVHSKLSRGERDHAIAEFTARRVRALVNVNVLSEGFDAPHIDVVAMLRPTKSPGLYYQQVGRGLRLSPGKTDCLVLDFAGNIDEHGPIDKIVVKERTGTGDAPTKTCPECGSLVPIGVMVCEECGRLFEQQEPGEKHPPHAASASESAILSVQNVVPKNYKVARVGFFKHAPRDGRKPTLRADYLCADGSVFKEWWCFDHEGYAREKAIQWWSAIQPTVSGMPVPPPDSVDSAIIALNDVRIRYRTPTAIKVSEYGKYPSIVYHEFAEHGAT